MMASGVFLDVIKQNMKLFTESKSTKNTAKPIILILLIFAFEQIIKTKNFYSCPATGHRVYGAFFLFGPGACFFLLALLVNGPFWTSVTGCYRASVDIDYAKVFKKTVEALLICAFVALVWFVIAFANAKFYVCFQLGAESSNATDAVKATFSKERVRSTIISCGMLFAAVCFALIHTVVRRCFCTDAKDRFPSVHKYEKLELNAALKKFQNEMEVLAKQEGEAQTNMYLSRGKEERKQARIVIEEARESLETKYCQKPPSCPAADVSVEHVFEENRC